MPFDQGGLILGVLVELGLALLRQIALKSGQLRTNRFGLVCVLVLIPFVKVGEHVIQEEA